MQFNEFVNHRERESRDHLKLIEKILKSGKDSLKVKSFLSEDDPYLFVYAPNDNFTFEGIRVYPIGDTYAYKIQNAEDTQPFGKAYSLDLEKMFADHMSDNIESDEAAKRVSENVKREINRFFELTGKAEEELAGTKPDSGYVLKTGGSDYSSLIFNKL
jgi:hypothetical protein